MGRKRDRDKVIDLHETRERLLALIGTDRAAFTMYVNEYQDMEYFSVRVDYEICGVHYEKGEGRLKILVNLNAMDPVEVRLDAGKVREVMTLDIAQKCRFLLAGTYYLYFDRDSILELNREARRKELRRDLEFLIRDRGLTMDEALPAVYGFVKDSLAETSYGSLEELASAGPRPPKPEARMVLELTQPSVPCPHCSGLLSMKVLKDLMMKWYSRYYRDDDSPEY